MGVGVGRSMLTVAMLSHDPPWCITLAGKGFQDSLIRARIVGTGAESREESRPATPGGSPGRKQRQTTAKTLARRALSASTLTPALALCCVRLDPDPDPGLDWNSDAGADSDASSGSDSDADAGWAADPD